MCTFNVAQSDMFAAAKAKHETCVERVDNWDDFMAALGRKHCALVPWCDEEEAEDEVKVKSATRDAMGAKSLCKPLEQPPLAPGTLCFFKKGTPAKCWCLFGRSY